MGADNGWKFFLHHMSAEQMSFAKVGQLRESLPKVGADGLTVLVVDTSIFVYDMFHTEPFLKGFLELFQLDITENAVADFLAMRFLSLAPIANLVDAARSEPKLKVVFVMDGERPSAKLACKSRDKKAKTALKRLLDAVASADYMEVAHRLQSCFRRTADLGKALMAGLRKLRFNVVMAKEESDHLMAAMYHSGGHLLW